MDQFLTTDTFRKGNSSLPSKSIKNILISLPPQLSHLISILHQNLLITWPQKVIFYKEVKCQGPTPRGVNFQNDSDSDIYDRTIWGSLSCLSHRMQQHGSLQKLQWMVYEISAGVPHWFLNHRTFHLFPQASSLRALPSNHAGPVACRTERMNRSAKARWLRMPEVWTDLYGVNRSWSTKYRSNNFMSFFASKKL